ncbi:MAG: hypothetical protein JOZ15_14835 [Acidobacteria bacterium]|nr:hypothetical protein [Acidobacteriota bacterium]
MSGQTKRLQATKRTRRTRHPRLRYAGKHGDLTAWLVDGSYVRRNIDEEFSNFGHHYSYSEIPKGELWLDSATGPEEQKFYLGHMRVEYHLRARGVDEETARRRANAHERRQRARAGDLAKARRGKLLPQAAAFHLRLWKKLASGVEVWFVKGRLVRSVLDVEFTEGGHEHVYEFVPHGEVWIDDDLHQDEQGYVLWHELHERSLMSKGQDYDSAHEECSRLERYYRRHPSELHQALMDEGWC